jgi:hypothetical protein
VEAQGGEGDRQTGRGCAIDYILFSVAHGVTVAANDGLCYPPGGGAPPGSFETDKRQGNGQGGWRTVEHMVD